MLYFNKVLPFLVSPLFLALALYVVLRWWRPSWTWLAWVFLLILAMPKTADTLMFQLESRHPAQATQTLENADVIFVLGGSLRHMRRTGGQSSVMEMAHEGDRFEAGLALFERGLAPSLVFSDAGSPWSKGPSEGDVLRQRAIHRGVASEAILLTPLVENTSDEARAIKTMIPQGGKIILITSAYHMPRAAMLFEKEGVAFTPYPVDFRSLDRKTTILDFVPETRSLHNTAIVLREVLGWVVYKLIG